MRVLIFAALLMAACAAKDARPPDGSASSIGYESVQLAFDDLQRKPGTELMKRGSWTLIKDNDAQTMWTFVAEDHPAYPAAAKAIFSVTEGRARVGLRIKCEATKEACDAFAADMKARTGQAAQRTKEQFGRPTQ